MAEVTKEDITRIHDKLDPMATDLAVIKFQMKEHLELHKDTLKTWKHMAINGVIKVTVALIVGVVCYCWGMRK